MKHATRYVANRMRRVNRGRRAVSRQAAVVVKKLQQEPAFRRLVTEITRHLIELAIRITVMSIVNQCIQPGREQARVFTLRPRPIS
jgi:hypothetical protein